MNTAPNTLFLLIAQETETFAIGVYISENEARKNFIEILVKQRKYPKLQLMFEETFSHHLATDSHILENLWFSDHNDKNITNFFRDIVDFSIIEVNIGDIFDFSQYFEWDLSNLYSTLKIVKNGIPGILPCPYKLDDVLLRNIR